MLAAQETGGHKAVLCRPIPPAEYHNILLEMHKVFQLPKHCYCFISIYIYINLYIYIFTTYVLIYLHSYLLTYLVTYLLTYLLTYSLTPCSRVLLDKLTCSQPVKKFPPFYGTRRFITAFTSTGHLSLF